MAIAAPWLRTLLGVMTHSDRLPNLSIIAFLACAIALAMGALHASARRASGQMLERNRVPWNALALNGNRAPEGGQPYALLYVSSACPHCAVAAHTLDSVAARSGIPAYIVTDDAPAIAARFADSLQLHSRLALDTGGVLRRRAGLRFVPSLWLYDRAGAVQVVRGARAPAVIGALLGELQ